MLHSEFANARVDPLLADLSGAQVESHGAAIAEVDRVASEFARSDYAS
ncbi:hypothetical protein [Rhodococcus sp. NPDC127528]